MTSDENKLLEYLARMAAALERIALSLVRIADTLEEQNK